MSIGCGHPVSGTAGRLVGALVAIGLLLSFGQAGVVQAGQETTGDGVLHVRNDAAPRDGEQVWTLKEQWRLGGADEEDVLLGVVSQVIADEGRVYLLDYQLSQVHVVEPDGSYVTSLSREGEGPGEVRQPLDLLITPDDNLALMQSFPGKLVKIDRQGMPQGSITFGGTDPTQGGVVALTEAVAIEDGYVIAGTEIETGPAGQKRISFVAACDAEGTERFRLEEKPIEFDIANLRIVEKDQYVVARNNWAVGPDGRIYTAPDRDRYLIHVYGEDGALQRVMERTFEMPERTQEEKDRVRERLEALVARVPVEISVEVADTEQTIAAMQFDGEGNLWVQHGASDKNLPEGVLQRMDVFSPDGHYLRSIAIRCEGDPDSDRLVFLKDGRIIRLAGLFEAFAAMQGAGTSDEEEEQPLEVVCYEVAR